MGTMSFVHVIVIGLVSLFNFLNAGLAQVIDEKGAKECSIFEVVYLNAIGIRSGDVLVEVSTTIDTVKPKGDGAEMEGVFQSTIVRYRCVFDIEKSLFCMIRQDGPNNRVDISDLSSKPSETPPGYSAWAIDFQNERLFSAGHDSPLPWRLTAGRPLPEVLTKFAYLDPRSTSWIPQAGLVENELGHIRAICSGKDFLEKELVEDRLLKLTLFDGSYDDGSEKKVWEFDLENSLPVKFSEFAWHSGHGKFYPGRNGTMAWTVVNNYDVVSKTAFDDIADVRSVDGKSYPGHQETRMDFFWFSVNEEVEGRFFDGSVLKSLSDIRKCLQRPVKKEE